jgi:hypothetical protein
MQSIFAAVRLLGGSMSAAYALHTTVALIVASALIYLCRSLPIGHGVGAAMATATLLASPFLLGYDLLLLAIPMVWIVREAARTGYLPWEKPMLAMAFLLPLLSTTFADRLHVPLAPPVIMLLFVAVFRRAIRANRVSSVQQPAAWLTRTEAA